MSKRYCIKCCWNTNCDVCSRCGDNLVPESALSGDVGTERLKPENAAVAENALAQPPLSDAEGWIRWRSEKSLQLDGDFTMEQLKALVAIMESWKDSPSDPSTATGANKDL